jgi:hypothetical protein
LIRGIASLIRGVIRGTMRGTLTDLRRVVRHQHEHPATVVTLSTPAMPPDQADGGILGDPPDDRQLSESHPTRLRGIVRATVRLVRSGREAVGVITL